MSIALNLFPVLFDELIEKIGYETSSFNFQYNTNGIEYPLNIEPMDIQSRLNNFHITDERGVWDAESHNLYVDVAFTINNPAFLFGSKGIVSMDSELGLALVWSSKASNQRSADVIGGFRYTSDEVQFSYSTNFSPGLLKGSVTFEIVLFLKTAGTRKIDEQHLANSTGMLLGSLYEALIVIDGNGSVFPIVEVSKVSQPLWWVICEWIDPMLDRFDEDNVRICLNRSHPSFELLNVEGGIKGSPLLIDIIASAIQIIIQKARESEEWNDIVAGNNYETGSVAAAINYFMSTFRWDASSPENLALSIRLDFESRI